MDFYTYIKELKISQEEIAKNIGTTQANISRWANRARMPSKKFMQKIVIWSNGAVQPNDFYLSTDADES